ncbi:MAG: tetratricopeptide repeat protein [Chlamydiales bacterium]
MSREHLLIGLTALSLPFICSLQPVKTSSPHEAMQLRRIAEYWKEGDYSAAKNQILELLKRYPDSSAKEQLYAMLGDLYFFESSYKDAIEAYTRIQDKELKQKTSLNALRALFATNRFSDLIEMAKTRLEESDEILDVHYLLAESLWREGLQTKDAEKKLSYFQQAKQEYQPLLKTKFRDATLFPLASVCRDLKEYAEAASLFALLIEKHPDKKEELLFQVASLKAHDDKEEACKVFASIYPLNGKRAPAAAFNHLALLFQAGKYSEFITAEREARKHIASDQLPLINLYLGKSCYTLKEYTKAIGPLQAYVKEKQREQSPELKNALLALINCAKEMKNLPLMTESVHSLEVSFPQDLDYAKALALLAHACEESGDLALAEAHLSKAVKAFPEYHEKETLIYERARLLYKAKKWQESRAAFGAFLHEFPNSTHLSAAWHELIHAALMEKEGATGSDIASKNEMVISLLRDALGQKEVWQEQEKENYTLLLCKTLYTAERWNESAESLNSFVHTFSHSSSIPEAQLMLALSLHHLGNEGESFLDQVEKALSFNPQIESRGQLHLMLYNGYLKASGQKPGEKWLLEKAADHLYECVVHGKVEIKRDNLLWLANYYYTRAKEENGTRFATRAADIFEQIVKNLKAITCDTLDLEAEVLKYADLLTLLGKHGESLALLQELRLVYDEKSDLPWKFLRRAMLELGRAYTRVGDHEQAILAYDHLISSASHAASIAADAALLERARLEYGLLKTEEKNDGSPRLTSILAALKDLQIKKKLTSEPIHLEAALEYAQIKTDLAPDEKKAERILALLTSLKEEFLSEEDPQAQEYQACRLRLSEKDYLFQTYMKFVDALLLEARARLCENVDEACEMQLKAMALLDELKESSPTLTPYLREKLEANKHI